MLAETITCPHCLAEIRVGDQQRIRMTARTARDRAAEYIVELDGELVHQCDGTEHRSDRSVETVENALTKPR
jgi:hypothetical protein